MEPVIHSLPVATMEARTNSSGVALIVVLIMLTAMTIAGVALVRVVDSANVISGNFAFRQATLSIADLGTEAAAAELSTLGKAALELPYPPGCTTRCRYYPARSVGGAMVNAKGLPIKGSIDGTTVQDIDWSGNDFDRDGDGNIDIDINGDGTVNEEDGRVLAGFRIRYVIDRQCLRAPVSDAVGECLSDTPQGGGSKKSGATVFTPASTVYYRVTILVTGPRRTQSQVQVVLGY